MTSADALPTSFSLFHNAQDNDPKPRTTTWLGFREGFKRHQVAPNKDSVALWSPATFAPGTPRRQVNVVEVAFAVADIDSKKQSVTETMIADLTERLAPFEYVLHTSHSHNPAADKCAVRVILPLVRPFTDFKRHSIGIRAWKKAWARFEKWIGIPIDEQCADASRMYYMPSCPPEREGDALIYHNAGRLVVLDELLDVDSEAVPGAAETQKEAKPLKPAERERLEQRMAKYTKTDVALAFRRVLKGEPFAVEGDRDNLLTKMCGALASWAPMTSAESIADMFDKSLDAMAAEAAGAPTRETVVEKLTRFQLVEIQKQESRSSAYSEEVSGQASAKIETLTNGARATPYTMEEIGRFAGEQDCTPKEFLSSRLILQNGSSYYIWCVDGYPSRPQPYTSAQNAAKKWLPIMPVAMSRVGGNGQWIPLDLGDMIERYGDVVHQVVSDLRISKSRFDAVTKTFYEAVTPIRREHKPEFDEDVHGWLQILGDSVLDWVAAVTRLERQSAALVIVGKADIGKGLLARGLASLWNATGTPADLERILDEFTEDLAICPLVYVDEKLPYAHGRDLSAKLRSLIGSQSRALRRKFLPPTELVGAVRLLMTANNDSILGFHKANLTREDNEAVASRFLYVQAGQSVIDYLKPFQERGELNEWTEGGRIARHALWLRENRELDETKRFLVMGHEESVHRKLVTQGDMESAVCEWLVGYLQMPSEVERTCSAFVERDLENGELWINVAAITETWTTFIKAERQPTTTAVGRVLRNLSIEKKARWRGGRQTKMYKLDLKYIYEWADSSGHGDVGLIRENLGLKSDDKSVAQPATDYATDARASGMPVATVEIPLVVSPNSPFAALATFSPSTPVESDYDDLAPELMGFPENESGEDWVLP